MLHTLLTVLNRELIGKPLERIARALGFSDSEALLVDLSNDGICIKELNGSYLTFRAGVCLAHRCIVCFIYVYGLTFYLKRPTKQLAISPTKP